MAFTYASHRLLCVRKQQRYFLLPTTVFLGRWKKASKIKHPHKHAFSAAPFWYFCVPVLMPLQYVRISSTEMRIVSNTQVFVRAFKHLMPWCSVAISACSFSTARRKVSTFSFCFATSGISTKKRWYLTKLHMTYDLWNHSTHRGKQMS